MHRLAQRILEHDDRPLYRVDLEDWPEPVYVRPVTGLQRERFAELSEDGNNASKAKSLLVAFSVCDEHGEQIFTEDQADELAGKNAAVLEVLFVAALAASKLREQDVESLENFTLGDPVRNGASITA